MLELVRSTFVNNAKLALVGVAALALGGAGTVASVTLSGNSVPAPATSHSPNAHTQDATDTPDSTDTPDATDSTDAQDTTDTPDSTDTQDAIDTTGITDTQDTTDNAGDTGARPTDTHGYCVSQAVAAAHAGGKTGKDVSAAAHRCPTPTKGKASHGKSPQPHGKSAQPRGKAGSRP